VREAHNLYLASLVIRFPNPILTLTAQSLYQSTDRYSLHVFFFRMPKTKPGYYAVKFGWQPDIYLTWDECLAQVKGFSEAKFKKFYQRELAEDYINGKEEEVPKIENDQDMNSLQVWTDGSSFGNGSIHARAGIGVFWGDNDTRNLSERLPGDQTNNRAEIYAVIRALELCKDPEKMLEIMTDSMYVINAFECWCKKWEKNGWITTRKEPVKNKELFLRMNELVKARSGQVKMVFVRGHSGNYGNKQADHLAKFGSLKSL
jgi:ribonuclease HI